MNFEFLPEEYGEEAESMLKDKLARANYEVISSKDVDFASLKDRHNKKEIAKTLQDMIDYFIETEEYEKCSKIKKELNKLLDI
tara:strand:- start:17 stop:265 length:249 start_codon:yes stop_codon:yes gene_type:complete